MYNAGWPPNAGFCCERTARCFTLRGWSVRSATASIARPAKPDVASEWPVAQRNGDGRQPSRTYARRSLVPERACPMRRRRQVPVRLPDLSCQAVGDLDAMAVHDAARAGAAPAGSAHHPEAAPRLLSLRGPPTTQHTRPRRSGARCSRSSSASNSSTRTTPPGC